MVVAVSESVAVVSKSVEGVVLVAAADGAADGVLVVEALAVVGGVVVVVSVVARSGLMETVENVIDWELEEEVVVLELPFPP